MRLTLTITMRVLDSPDETRSDKLNESDLCGPAVDADCLVDLPDSLPAVSTLSVDLLPSDAGSVVASEVGQNLSCDSLQGIRTRYGRVVRPVFSSCTRKFLLVASVISCIGLTYVYVVIGSPQN